MRQKKQGIYEIRNVANDKVYIGQVCLTKGHYRRWSEHKSLLRSGTHYNFYLQDEWDVYGESSFVFTFVEEVHDDDELDQAELKWITETWDMNYNIQSAPTGSLRGQRRILSEEAKANLAAANRSRPWTAEDRAKQSVALSGIERSDEFKQRRREIMTGSKHAEETKEKIRQKHLGRKCSPETIEKMRQAALKRWAKIKSADQT